ncbi:MAG: ATP-binding protein [Cyclobacteriaceae bacterium]
MARALLLEKGKIESRTEYKYALLRGQLGLLLGAICFIYIFIDIFSGVPVYIPWYLAGIGMACLVILQNRKGNYLMASVLLLITANMLVFLIASLEDSQGGAFFYFMATSATSLVVLNPISKRLGLVFVAFSIALSGIAYFGDLPFQVPPENQNYVSISFTVNFLLGLLSSVLILHFVMTRNQESEDSLLKNHQTLQELTKELEKSKNRFALAVEGTKAGIYERDIDTNILYVSSRFRDLLGFSSVEDSEIDYPVFESMIHPDDKERASSLVNAAIAQGTSYQYETRLILKNGAFRWFLVSGIVSKKSGSPHLAVGSIIDIHDRKMAEQQLLDKNQELEKTNKELDRFVYSASHDMRAPLSTLRGLLNLARMTHSPEEIVDYHEKMVNRIHTMEGFIKEVTDYSRNSRLEIKASKINLRSLFEEVKTSFEFLAQEAFVECINEIDPQLVINSDKERLKVILNNLVSNAIKYYDPDKPKRFVKVEAFLQKECCTIRISDNGIGIKPEYQEKIFDMFFRASERSDGSGLGLYIVKETVQRLSGEIRCQSQEQGEGGSVFEIVIPDIGV